MTLTAWEKTELSIGNEALFLRLVMDKLDCLSSKGILYFHSGDPRRDRLAGFPDLLILGRYLLFVELKSSKGRMSLDQIAWRDKLQARGCRWALWRPEDWESGEIDKWIEELL